MTKTSALVSLLAGLLTVGMSVHTASAAPQALALVDSAGEVALQCDGGVCAASFSAFCLQQSRPMPATGTAYGFADTDEVRLVGVRPDGSRVVLDASSELRLATQRRQLVVRIAMSEDRLEALGLKSVSVEIGRDVTLLPKAVAGDPNPMSEGDIALVAGPLRRAGTRVVEGDSSRIGAARWVLQLSDKLPPSGMLAPKARGRFLDHARSAGMSASLSTAERDVARDILNLCEVRADVGAYDSLRQCFELHHDRLLWRLNVDYWLALHYGS